MSEVRYHFNLFHPTLNAILTHMFKGRLFMWLVGIFGTVVVAFLTAIVTQWVTDKSPDIIVRQYYNSVDAAVVPERVGELVIDYKMPVSSPPGLPRQRAGGVYLLEVVNEGRGPEEDLRMQVRAPDATDLVFVDEPDLRVYRPAEIVLDEDGFFMELGGFPKDATAYISFEAPANKEKLCDIKIKVAGRSKEGSVERIRGVKCP